MKLKVELLNIDNIPLALYRPNEANNRNVLAVWLPYLGGERETIKPHLQKLADDGYYAISIDPYLHGSRKENIDIRERVFRNFRQEMWSILGYTVLDVLKVIDWGIAEFKLKNKIVAGGLSMGGDIAITLAGIDSRIERVSTVGASPDWNRPGMTDVFDSGQIIAQGTPTSLGQWFYDRLNPMEHISSYAHLPLMHFELGATDTHISPEWSLAFREELSKTFPEASDRITININDELNHIELLQNEMIVDRAIEFLSFPQN